MWFDLCPGLVGDYFFSGHVAYSVLFADAWRRAFGWCAYVLAILGASLVVLAQLILHQHYTVDVAAGAATTIAIIFVSNAARMSSQTEHSPLLPRPPALADSVV